MAENRFSNRLKDFRTARGLSQDQLAELAGVSRTGIGAIEAGRLVPSTATALALAAAFGCRVEDLFTLTDATAQAPAWAIAPTHEPARYWQAEVDGRLWAYPAEAVVSDLGWHDGLFSKSRFHEQSSAAASATLVVACCDPAAGLMATEYARATGFRMLVLRRSSGEALLLLARGLVHVAGLHLSRVGENGNAAAAQEAIDGKVHLLRAARWHEGLALATGVRGRTVRSVLGANLRWVAREPGSGARKCMDELFGKRPAPRRQARDHSGVVGAISNGWADVGVSLRLPSEDAGLDFLPIREEDYDLCYHARTAADPRITRLVELLRSPSYRKLLSELPGYGASETGDVQECS